MCQQDYRNELLEALKSLENLNPDLKSSRIQRMFFLAGEVEKDFFPRVVSAAESLLQLYLHSSIKKAGAQIMKEYLDCLEEGTRTLRLNGTIAQPLLTTSTTFSTALVPREHTEPLDFCKILNRTQLPKPLVKAADAFRRRNQVVDSIFIYVFRVMWIIDAPAACQWMTDYFQSCQGNLDPDIARDALASAIAADISPSMPFVRWAVTFAGDPNLLEYWPMVTRYADRFLCITALKQWANSEAPRNSRLMQLVRHVRHRRFDEDTLLKWCQQALEDVGEAVQRFLSLEENTNSEWRGAALMTELHRIANAFVPVMLVLDQLLALPDGATQVAMAFLGLAGETLEKWELYLLDFSRRAVRRYFLWLLKKGEKPVDTIRKLTFGDSQAFNAAYAMLDLVTEKFDSVKQREKAVDFLSVYYASYRRPQLLGAEIAHRYKSLMRLIHEDYLSHTLDATQFNEIHSMGILQEIASITSEARRFLARRKASENTLEEMLAAKISFERFIREKRLVIIRNVLCLSGSGR